MSRETGLRERKKAAQRERIALEAERLFAQRGFDAVSVQQVAEAAGVSEQTVYNYFPAKHDLALDRADTIRQRYHDAVVGRDSRTSPANALRAFAVEDVERFRVTDPQAAAGQFYALCTSSSVVRRYGLVVRDEQTAVISQAIEVTTPDISPVLAYTHAAALVSIFQMLADQIGHHIAARTSPAAEADTLLTTVHIAFDDLDQHFAQLTSRPSPAKDL